MPQFICPVCKNGLEDKGKSLVCSSLHCFDKAKSGYINLLLSNKMNSKAPGDNEIMVAGRNFFLNKGYYAHLRDELCKQVLTIAKAVNNNTLQLADVGCGEGYYTAGMAEALRSNGIKAEISGIDISKKALNFASKRDKSISFGVASCFSLPYADESCDILTELFAPYCGEEFYRALKLGGILLIVIPAENHLFELKQAIYEKPYKNEVKDYALDGFEFKVSVKVEKKLLIDNNEDIKSLFAMTPYYYKTSKEDAERLEKLEKLEVTAEFEILQYVKKQFNYTYRIERRVDFDG